MENSLVTHQIEVDKGKFIQEGNNSNVQYVAKPFIWESMLGRNHTNVQNVTKSLSAVHVLVNISKFILGRDLINVQHVARLLIGVQI